MGIEIKFCGTAAEKKNMTLNEIDTYVMVINTDMTTASYCGQL